MGAGLEALAVSNLSKSFGGLNAVNNVSFNVEVGERLAIIGPNGAGKTTLFQLISGMFPPSKGSISVYGKDVTHFPPIGALRWGWAAPFRLPSFF